MIGCFEFSCIDLAISSVGCGVTVAGFVVLFSFYGCNGYGGGGGDDGQNKHKRKRKHKKEKNEDGSHRHYQHKGFEINGYQ